MSLGTGGPAVKLAPCVTDDDTPLLYISDHPDDAWTLRDDYEGVQVFGGTGAGKTSGSGQALAESFLRAGMGGIQEWLSFYFKSPMTAPELYPEHDLFIQLMKLKNTLRHLQGEDLITHLGQEYYD